MRASELACVLCACAYIHFDSNVFNIFCCCFQVSLDAQVRDTINRKMLTPSSNAFDEAQIQIYTLMQRDSYPRFLNSSAFKRLLIS